MPIHFNFAAFIQAIMVAGIFCLLIAFDHNTIFQSIGVAKSEQFYVICYFLIFFLGITEIIGLKGRVYWIPTWFFVIVLALFGGLYLKGWLQLANASLVLAMGLAIFKISDRQFIKKFQKSKEALRDLEKFNSLSHDKRKAFWNKALQSFIFPSHFFLFFYPIYKLINPNTIEQFDFVQHNLKLINKIKSEVPHPVHQQQLREYEAALELAMHFKKYKHPGYSLTNLKKIIKRSSGK